ncbi:seryl-tRNA synthetase [Drepanopeziza brunnea f. sp. 'multigermtubi' MB_m1]|uniref:serine--tRNA ligase n=1 Tax=Marssonina brunnea f. sp. multigermtubi (strain MB_m1) TaxID=1072389 RepID=K1WNP5_MARBU|nr:seryl-tRNA synthetase [Drepanopeziza brunnea f. sp. 'multigermtubi' MB_m1]EKD13977.1 seryl-tRNA synthetase [Drepanopeziza brunnea f. sp. 'multigermtubi' MB_m1]
MSQPSFTCLQCRLRILSRAPRHYYHSSPRLYSEAPRPSLAPKVSIDIKHIRQNAALHENNCLGRNYKKQAEYPARINSLFERWHGYQREARSLRERNNRLKLQLANPTTLRDEESEDVRRIRQMTKQEIIDEAKSLKVQLSKIEEEESALTTQIDALAAAIPNLTSKETPQGNDPTVVGYINQHPESDPAASDRVWRSHVHIGTELNLLDFAGAATTSGWGWYYLLNEAAQLEQALVQYALGVARKRGWGMVSPPSMVYSHIAAACGFQPRDQNGEQQIYNIQQNSSDVGRKPGLSLAGTAEIPLASMKANTILDEAELPAKRVGVSRSYRAEAGARGMDTKGLYRVHEFTKVEMFAWTKPSTEASVAVFDEMVSIQTEILTSLGLHCRILEMPITDLGASATRKRDIEAFFPSRRSKDNGWGEVSSVSTCTDYQTRRLATRVDIRTLGGKIAFPYTVNGTALAVPRVLAAILENGWDEARGEVEIPEVLRPWMDGMKVISKKSY